MMLIQVQATLRTLFVLAIAKLAGLGFIVHEAVALSPKQSRNGATTCEYDGKLYPPGEFRLSPCVTCKCVERTGELRCVSETCDSPQLPDCVESGPAGSGRCCGDCVEYGCVYNGTKYLRGAVIPAGPCTRCYCPWAGGGEDGRPACVSFHCPTVQCVDGVVPRGHCCPVCPNGPNCWLDDLIIPAGQDVWVDKCRSCYCPGEVEGNGEPWGAPSASHIGEGEVQERRAICYRHSGCIEW